MRVDVVGRRALGENDRQLRFRLEDGGEAKIIIERTEKRFADYCHERRRDRAPPISILGFVRHGREDGSLDKVWMFTNSILSPP